MSVWSKKYGCYVSESFMNKRKPPPKELEVSLDDCIIVINIFGFYDLYLEDVKIKRITFNEFLKYKRYVKDVIQEQAFIIKAKGV